MMDADLSALLEAACALDLAQMRAKFPQMEIDAKAHALIFASGAQYGVAFAIETLQIKEQAI